MRFIIPIFAVVALVGTLAAVKVTQIRTLIGAGERAKQAGPPPETVSSVVAKRDVWQATLDAVGSVRAEKGVSIANDSAGIVNRIGFESGDTVKQGAVLVELDTSVERAQLASAESRASLSRTILQRTAALQGEGVSTQAELDSAEAAATSAEADVLALRAQIARKVVRAPFAGKLGIRAVNVGQYLAPGSTITTLQSEREAYVDFTVPQQRVDALHLGLEVELAVDDGKLPLSGVVAAIEPSVDEQSRSATVRASVKDPDKRLLPGMFVNVSVILDQKREPVIVPVTAVVSAPYGDSVFLIEEDAQSSTGLVARQQFVKLGQTRGDFVEVSKGLSGGERLVSAGAFKLRNGAPIQINDSVALQPELNPKPQNR